MANACAGTCRPTGHVSVARLTGRKEELETKVLWNRRAVLAAAVRTLGTGAADSSALLICGDGGEGARGGGREWGYPSCATSRNRSQIESRSRTTILGSSRTGTPMVGTTKKRGLTTIDRTCIDGHLAIHGQPPYTFQCWGYYGERETRHNGHCDGKADGGCEGRRRGIMPRGDRMCVVLDRRGWDGRGSGLFLVTNHRYDHGRGNEREPYDELQASGLKPLDVKRSSGRQYVVCRSHGFGGSYEGRRWRRDRDVSRGERGVRRKGRCVKASSSVDGDGDGIPFLGGPRQRRRLADLIRSIPERSNAYFHSPWRRLLWGGTSLLGGFYSAQAVTLSFGALGINDIAAAAVCLFSAEFLTRYYYSHARHKAFFLTLLNLFKLGFTCGLFVDAFKLAL